MTNLGFTRVWVLAGGYHAWISADLPLDEKCGVSAEGFNINTEKFVKMTDNK